MCIVIIFLEKLIKDVHTAKFFFTRYSRFSFIHIVWLTIWAWVAYMLYAKLGLSWLSIPWLPVSLIGIAVAFYVGFKNNSAYDRMWEARKIWGGIVNDSRAWGIACKHFITDQFATEPFTTEELNESIQKLIHKHIAWVYTLRDQLLVTSPWEHMNASFGIRRLAKFRVKNWGVGLFDVEPLQETYKKCLDQDEIGHLEMVGNKATHILDFQASDLKKLRKSNIIENFRHMDMQQILYRFYNHQGKCERIKNYPLPRQYASMSFLFVGIFIALLPFGLMPEFAKIENSGIWMAIPFTVLVGWVFVMMELVGDYSENPFEGMGNDIPMLSLCRIIEIDLREMLGEDDIPEKIAPVNYVIM